MPRLRTRAALTAALLLSSAPAGAQPDASRAVLHVAPTSVEVGMFFRGATVHVEGIAPPGRRLALVCVGKQAKVELKRKGKVWNALWMNVGSIAFDRVPSLLHAYADVDGAAVNQEALPADLRLGLGAEGVESHVLPASADETTHRLFREFVRLRVKEGLYSFGKLHAERLGTGGGNGGEPRGAPVSTPVIPVSAGGTSVQGRSPPERAADLALPARISADFELPASIPPGQYEIRLIGYRDGTAELLASETLAARRVGLALLISSFSEHHGLVHGIFAVLLAAAAGFLTGMLFASAKKGH
jgi:Putative transmembrane protein (Alph_Pro_TM)